MPCTLCFGGGQTESLFVLRGVGFFSWWPQQSVAAHRRAHPFANNGTVAPNEKLCVSHCPLLPWLAKRFENRTGGGQLSWFLEIFFGYASPASCNVSSEHGQAGPKKARAGPSICRFAVSSNIRLSGTGPQRFGPDRRHCRPQPRSSMRARQNTGTLSRVFII